MNTKLMLNSALSKIATVILLLLITGITTAWAAVISYKKEANGALFTLVR